MTKSFYCALAFVLMSCVKHKPETMTRIEFSFVADDLDANTAAARPKAIYLAGSGSSRIEQYADATSDVKNLIVVREPDIWLVDGARRTVGHAVTHGPDLNVHNPILGPDGPEELFSLEWGRETSFFDANGATELPQEQIGNTNCEVRTTSAKNFEVRLYIDPIRKVPVELRAFKDAQPLFIAHYNSYRIDLPFDASLFGPPSGYTLVEAGDER